MAIKGLTDRESLKPALPRLGKLRKGGEKKGNRLGDDLDYFRFTSEDSNAVNAFRDAYGDNPRMVNIILYNETPEENFSTWIEAWDASGMVMRSDGEFWRRWREGSVYKTGKKKHVDVAGQKEVGRLEILIPELLQLGFVGTVTFETHSNHDLRNIMSVLFAVERERGDLRGASFVMRRVQEEISTPGWGDRSDKRSKTKKWLVKLETPRNVFAELVGSEYKMLGDGEILDAEIGAIPEQAKAKEPQEQVAPVWKPETIKAIIDAGYSKNRHSVMTTLAKTELHPSFGDKWILLWFKFYRDACDMDFDSDGAVEKATKEYIEAVNMAKEN